jgi:gliding motility-associated-like protein
MACAPADILLSSTPGGFSYAWDFGDGTGSTGDFSIMHSFENQMDRDTTYSIQLISTSYFSCHDTGYTQITVHPSPRASFTADPVSQMIPDRTITITNNTPAGNWTYLWHFGDDSTSWLRDPVSHTYAGPDDYLIRLLVEGTYCSDSTWQSIEIVPHPPVAEFKPVRPGCMPLTIQFENSSAFSNSFLWEFGDGAVSNKPNPEYTYYEPGVYKIKLTAWGDGGSDTYSTVNNVWVLPNAYFEIAPRFVYVNDQAVHFFNLSDNGDIYVWDFGDGTGSAEMNPTHVYTQEGNYDVTLNVWTENECYDLYSLETAVLVEPTGKIVFPNAFRPESPIEENRIFKPGVIDHVDEYHLMVFNRWGELIFESFDKDTGWDGTVSGKRAKQDVYVWKVEGKYSGGQTFVQTGDVTLMH